MTPQLHAKGATKPFNVYLFRGEDQDYARQALRLHNDEFGGQTGLEDTLDKQMAEEYILHLKKRYSTEVRRADIACEFRERYGKVDKDRIKTIVKTIEKAGIVVIR